jgi:hypothetical protein
MTNHVHELVEGELIEGISCTMKAHTQQYAQWFNQKRGRDGPLYSQRFWARPVEIGGNFVRTLTYIDQNPVKAGLVDHPAAYYWGSAYNYFGGHLPDWLDGSLVQAHLDREFAAGLSPVQAYLARFGKDMTRELYLEMEERVRIECSGRSVHDIPPEYESPEAMNWFESRASLADGLNVLRGRLILPFELESVLKTLAPTEVGRFGSDTDWSPRMRLVLVACLRSICRLGIGEIAKRLDLSAGTISKRWKKHGQKLAEDACYQAFYLSFLGNLEQATTVHVPVFPRRD